MYETRLPLHLRKCGKTLGQREQMYHNDKNIGIRLTSCHKKPLLKSSRMSHCLMTHDLGPEEPPLCLECGFLFIPLFYMDVVIAPLDI